MSNCPRYTNQPKRAVCPKCGKRGVGPWLRVQGDFITTLPAQVRSCRYCKHAERQRWDRAANGGLGGMVPVVEN